MQELRRQELQMQESRHRELMEECIRKELIRFLRDEFSAKARPEDAGGSPPPIALVDSKSAPIVADKVKGTKGPAVAGRVRQAKNRRT